MCANRQLFLQYVNRCPLVCITKVTFWSRQAFIFLLLWRIPTGGVGGGGGSPIIKKLLFSLSKTFGNFNVRVNCFSSLIGLTLELN